MGTIPRCELDPVYYQDLEITGEIEDEDMMLDNSRRQALTDYQASRNVTENFLRRKITPRKRCPAR